jgi:hypothetical protein
LKAREEKAKIENALKTALVNVNLKAENTSSPASLHREEKNVEASKPLYLVRYE